MPFPSISFFSTNKVDLECKQEDDRAKGYRHNFWSKNKKAVSLSTFVFVLGFIVFSLDKMIPVPAILPWLSIGVMVLSPVVLFVAAYQHYNSSPREESQPIAEPQRIRRSSET